MTIEFVNPDGNVVKELSIQNVDDGTLRTFDTGATRDTSQNKLDFEGFLSPQVLYRYAQYMHDNRQQSDGSLRDSDNWQKGIPRDEYMKSAWRHFFDWWEIHRANYDESGTNELDCQIEESMCALLFNVMGYLHEHLKEN